MCFIYIIALRNPTTVFNFNDDAEVLCSPTVSFKLSGAGDDTLASSSGCFLL